MRAPRRTGTSVFALGLALVGLLVVCAPLDAQAGSDETPAAKFAAPRPHGERVRSKIPLFSEAVLSEHHLVEADRLYERRRAMVEDGEPCARSLPRVNATGDAAPKAEARPRKRPDEANRGDRSPLRIVLALAFALGCGVLWLRYGRRSI